MADKSNAPKANTHRKSILLFGLLSLGVLVLCMAVVLGVSFSMITEGVYEFQEPGIESATPRPSLDDDVVDYLDRLTESASKSNTVFIDSFTELSVNTDTIEFDGSESEKNALLYMKDTLLNTVDSMYPKDHEGKFEDGFKGFPRVYLTEGSYSSAVCTQGRNNENGEYEDGDCYFFDITVPGGTYPPSKESAVSKTFSLADNSVITDAVKKELSSIMKIEKLSVIPGDFKIEAKSSRITDQMLSSVYTRNYRITITAAFIGDFTSLGTKTLSFDYSVAEKTEFTWAGISFNEKKVQLLEGDSQILAASVVMNDYADYEISFKSSDESIAKIDEIGNVTGIKYSATPVTITVNVKYLGKEFSDSCEVYVTVPVKEIKISDDELKMFPGNTAKLSATLKPKDATIKDILWISEDENVVRVEPDGTVTAVGSGTAKIIAVSKDGYFRDSCTVLVYGNGGVENE